jgi:HPt (histidine-containing phosphotransfer) domain-containing protein
MQTALAGGDAVRLDRAAHRLKGTVGYLGAAPAMDAVQRVEQIGLCGDLTGAAEAIRRLAEQIEVLKTAVLPHRNGA